MSTLFINPVSENIHLIVIEEQRFIEEYSIQKGDDFFSFPDKIIEMIHRYRVEEIWCICGPGAFTRVRIVTLTVNTLALSKNIRLKGCHFFELIVGYTPILKANDKEYITEIDGKYTLILKENLKQGKYMGYGDKNDFTNIGDFIEYSENNIDISRVFTNKDSLQALSPIYLKGPHITWSKKNK